MSNNEIVFKKSTQSTLGIELEVQLIDPASGKLVSRAPKLISRIHDHRFKPELFQCILEINTEVCNSFRALDEDLSHKLETLEAASRELNMQFLLAGTHPFSHWRNQQVTQTDRYINLLNRIQWPLRRFLIFGIHLHVGVDSGDKAIYLMNRLSSFIPLFIALSASSPYWIGYDTGMASIRSNIFDGLPRAGLPQFFQNWNEYEYFVQKLIRCSAIDSFRDIWWDIRPHPEFGTVEIRVCDTSPTLKENLAISAFIFCLIKKLESEYRAGEVQIPVSPWLLQENKWRASRSGVEAELIQENSETVIPITERIYSTYESLLPFAREHDCFSYINCIPEIIQTGPSYIRQRNWVQQTKSNFSQVIKNLQAEFASNNFLTDLD